jgi:hypothetical protein
MSSGGWRDPFAVERVDDQVEGFAGDVALQHSQDVVAAVALCPSLRGELACPWVVDEPIVRDRPQGVVRSAVAAAVESVTLALGAC